MFSSFIINNMYLHHINLLQMKQYVKWLVQVN